MNYTEAREKLREAKREALANSCNIKVGRRELEVALDALSKPDMREKVREYMSELDVEYDRCMDWIEEHMDGEACQVSAMEMRAKTLMEIKNDLKGRLEESV